MKAVIQRVTRASVEVEERIVGAIGPGLLVLLGVAKGDGEADCRFMLAGSFSSSFSPCWINCLSASLTS